MKRSTLVVGSLAAALLGIVALFIGVLVEPSRAWFAYLAAWTFGVTVCVGALLLVMVGHASKGRWMVVTRRPAEAIVGALPLFALLFVPICFGLRQLYPWIDHPEPHKARYLSPDFFIARTALYFVVFITIGALLRRWSRRNDEDPSMARVLRMRRLERRRPCRSWASRSRGRRSTGPCPSSPHWWSTIFGLYYFAGSFVAAIALVSVVLYVPAFGVGALVHATPEHAQALGRLLFAMVAFWAYMAFSQLLIYWIADLPAEIAFYEARTRGQLERRHVPARLRQLRRALLPAAQSPVEAPRRLPGARGRVALHDALRRRVLARAAGARRARRGPRLARPRRDPLHRRRVVRLDRAPLGGRSTASSPRAGARRGTSYEAAI